MATRDMIHAMERSVQHNFGAQNCINCMCHPIECLYAYNETNVARASEDFFPGDPASHSLHVANVAFNSLFIGEIAFPDWDMFQSSHSLATFVCPPLSAPPPPLWFFALCLFLRIAGCVCVWHADRQQAQLLSGMHAATPTCHAGRHPAQLNPLALGCMYSIASCAPSLSSQPPCCILHVLPTFLACVLRLSRPTLRHFSFFAMYVSLAVLTHTHTHTS